MRWRNRCLELENDLMDKLQILTGNFCSRRDLEQVIDVKLEDDGHFNKDEETELEEGGMNEHTPNLSQEDRVTDLGRR